MAELTNYEGLEAGSEGNIFKAKDKFNKTLELNSKNREAKLNLRIVADFENEELSENLAKSIFKSALLTKRGKCTEAESLLIYIYKKKPNYWAILMYQGINYNKLKRYNPGLECLDRVTTLKPEVPFFLYLKAQIHHNMNHLSEAIDTYSNALQLDRGFPEAYWARGLVWRDLGDLDKSISDFESAIALNPLIANYLEENLQIFEVYNNRGTQYLIAGRYNQAIVDLKKAIEINSQFSEPYINLALAYRHINQQAKALYYYNRAILVDSLNPGLYFNKAVFFKETKKYNLAIEELIKVINLDHSYESAYRLIGEIYFIERMYKNAIPYLKKAIEYNRDYPWSYYWLALSYDNTRQWDEAIHAYLSFIEYAPDVYYTHRLKASERVEKLSEWLAKEKLKQILKH